MFPRFISALLLALMVGGASLLVPASPGVAGGLMLGDICRLKGQEGNTLQGLGLVVGLQGTGDPNARPTARALARMMQLMGGQVDRDMAGQLDLSDVETAKNVALVFVSAQIPPTGAQQGDTINLRVNAISAKSLEGGYLMLTPLLGPRSDNQKVFALAEGPLQLSPDEARTTATIQGGAKMEATVNTSFSAGGKITLIINRDFATFDTAFRIEEEINNLGEITIGIAGANANASDRALKARAIGQSYVEVPIPPVYRENPVSFISLILNIPIQLPKNSSRVVINERDGVVVIGEDVEIAPVLISHRGLRIEAVPMKTFVPLDTTMPLDPQAPPQQNAKLKNLADALNALDVPTEDLIAIIKTLKLKGDLYGEVIFQ
ncbi:Flagellar P-ring protein precursor [Roseimaritima multifibrata]|uniref:Flagellar P-ring protein n=1 Tax=Roseimaritima multifibrata TaxID=1930274 RepID=A0A517ML03_9BACT|nr:flagellar basal body P-ring protein FlgI [Roseimaritima multifibrata]QDS95576.1 Flagellar P-ring protein precursor [Roseimaritima multifibrata]